MVIWIIGLSGAGKTTLANLVVNKLRKKNNNIVQLDGDILREVFDKDTEHTIKGRAKNARRLSHLSKLLADQEIHVVASVLSIFPDWQNWNRANIKNYCQVYIDVPMDILIQREIKGLYAGARDGSIKNVVGVDIEFPEPVDNDLILDNRKERKNLDGLVEKIMQIPQIKKIMK